MVSALALLAVATSAQAETYEIQETTDFTGNGCPNLPDLNTVTSSLSTALNADSWTGSRFVNVNVFSEDYIEACNGSFGPGNDVFFADASTSAGRLAVYAGHGNAGLLSFSYPHSNGICNIDFSANMRLGSMSGAQAFAGMWLTSCNLRTCSIATEANSQWLRQQFGYHNSPGIGSNQARDFFNGTQSQANIGQWLLIMEDRPGTTNDNSPVVVTYGSSASDVANHRLDRMKAGIGVTPRSGGPVCLAGQPSFFFQVDMIDNGTSAICRCGQLP